MNKNLILELSNEHTIVAMVLLPKLSDVISIVSGVIFIGDRAIKFDSATVEFIKKTPNIFDEYFLGGSNFYRLVFQKSIIPLAPEFIFEMARFIQFST